MITFLKRSLVQARVRVAARVLMVQVGVRDYWKGN